MKIENNKYVVEFVEKGGEIFSFTNKETGMQYMYQGDSEYWSGKNPTLFPIVGSTFTKTYEAKGKTYSMKNHGIIRYATLKCTHKEDTSITFTLDADEETLKVYPYNFHYEITYTLKENTLEVVYNITNNDEEEMPFGFGLHPAFKVPLHEDEIFEEYTIRFEKEEKMQQIVFDPNKQKASKLVDVKLSEWQLNYDDIEKYETLVYQKFSSSFVTLLGKRGNGVKVSCAGYPFLAIWTAKARAPFLCIEPWYSHDDYDDIKVDFKDREGMIILQPNETFSPSYTITVL